MRRYFFIADNLEDVEKIGNSLKLQGFADNQYYVLSDSHSDTEKRKLNDVASIFRQDLIRYGEIGALVGLGAAMIILLLSYTSGWINGTFGWAPYVALAFLVLCFCTWEGAFLGFQLPNKQFKRFTEELNQGKHIFFIDLNKQQYQKFKPIIKWHPELREAGTGIGVPAWLQKSSHNIREAIKVLP